MKTKFKNVSAFMKKHSLTTFISIGILLIVTVLVAFSIPFANKTKNLPSVPAIENAEANNDTEQEDNEKAEAEAKAKAEAEQKAKEEAEQKAKEEADKEANEKEETLNKNKETSSNKTSNNNNHTSNPSNNQASNNTPSNNKNNSESNTQQVVQTANTDTGISWDGKSPIVYTYADGSTGTTPKDGATYEVGPGWIGTYEAPATNTTSDAADGICQHCGKKEWDGTNGTCFRPWAFDDTCSNCGTLVPVNTCHSCS